MATSDNVTNENSNDFSDGTFDPDIEARLYAEIYYSNETCPDDHESTRQNDLAGIVDSASCSLSQTTNTTDANPVLQNRENHLCTNNSIPFEFTKPDCTAKNRPPGRSPHVIDNRPNVSTRYPKTYRLLALKDLWLPPQSTEEHRSTARELPNVPSTSIEPSIAESNIAKTSSTTVPLNNPEKDFLTIEQPNDLNISAECALLLEEVRKAEARKQKERKEAKRQSNLLKSQKKKSSKIITKPFCGTAKLRRCVNAVNGMGITTETSKYEVISKKKKQTMKEAIEEAVEISSDSDTSILEVPVPPKAPPPVIQLQDSDDEDSRTSLTDEAKNKTSLKCSNENTITCSRIDSSSSESNDHLSLPSRQASPSKRGEIHDEAANDVASSVPHSEENTLILNCTDIQHGAATLEDIRKHREMGHVLSDDSMTESEANNWVNIAARQADSRGTEMGSIEQHNKSLWDQSIQGNPISENPRETLPSLVTQCTNRTFGVMENCVNYPVGNVDSPSTRKRPKDTETRIFGEFNVPEVPEKRKKRAYSKTRPNIDQNSLNDYFFKPMTKEMQTFYNNPWGGENLDVVDIQSKMPKHPSHWLILDADLRASISRKRVRPCPRCRSDSHYGKKCPEKPKPPSCCMCGETGHTETRCPGTMCLTCGSKYATYRPTCNYCSQLLCNMCQGTGHTNENCPDLWRRYHNTTTETMPIAPLNPAKTMKPPQRLSCCNCGKRGHDMTTCRQLQWSQHFTTPMYVSSYTDGPVYLTSPHESVQDRNPIEYIDLVETPGNSDPLHTQISHPHSAFHFLFECSNFDTNTEHEQSMVLNTLKNVHLEGFLAGRVKPTFLQAWQNSFRFRVQIYRDYNNKIRMKFATDTKKEVRWLKKILEQWFTRRDNERQYLVNDKFPYENSEDMIQELENKMDELNTLEEPVVIMHKLSNLIAERKISGATANLTRNLGGVDRWQEELRLHRQLVTSLYSKRYIKDPIIHIFRHRVNNLRQARMTPYLYMSTIFYYNELFTFRESQVLTAALHRAIPALEQWNWSDEFPHTTFGDTQRPAIEYENFHNDSIPHGNNFYVDFGSDLSCREQEIVALPINETGECSQMLQNFQSIQESDTFTTSNVTSNVYKQGSNMEKPLEILPVKKPNKMMLKSCRNENQTKTKKKDDSPQLLINLPKARRKRWRRLARDAINSARSLNLPHLKNMANSLRMKLQTNSAHTTDVMMLWKNTEIEIAKQQKGRKPKKRKRREEKEYM